MLAPLKTNILSYTAVIIVTDANGASATNTVAFDTLHPEFTIEAEDFNHSSGQYVLNPVPGSYAGFDGTDGVDAHSINIGNGQIAYRNSGLNTEGTGDKPRQAYIDAGWQDYNVGWTDGGEWANYTRVFPAGVYNVFIRAARGNGGNGSETLSFVTSDPTQPNQTTSQVGTFVIPSTGNWQSYQWTPLTDGGGALQKVTLSGEQTLRMTTVDGYNMNYYAFFLANTNLPTIHDIRPDGARLFQPTNTMSFVASSAAGIATAGISVNLYATNLLGNAATTNYTVANGLVISGPANDRIVLVPLQTNIMFYRAVINVTDQGDNSASATMNFNTLNPSYTFEAEDFDYNNGQFHDNPQTNAYVGAAGVDGVDAHHNPVGTQNGGPTGPYRDGYNNENTGDKQRDAYAGTA
ncbi:MAG: carbohydrate-binding protein [Verrucomicrobiota bacterium]